MTALDSASLKFWESVGLWGFIFVWVGVAGEGVEIFIKLFQRKLYERKKFCLDVIGAIFWAVLVVALAVEFLGNVKAMRIAESINSQLDVEAGRARKEAGAAIERAGIAEQKASEANERAAKFELEAAKLEQRMEQTSTNVAKLDPRKQPIKSISAVASVLIRGTNFLVFHLVPQTSDQDRDLFLKQQAHLDFGGKDGTLIGGSCKEFNITTVENAFTLFRMSFNWPSDEWFVSQEVYSLQETNLPLFKDWVERKNVSTEDLDKETVYVGISLPPLKGGMEIVSGNCVVTINGLIRKNFSFEKYTRQSGFVLLPITTNSP
jgi:hypothetical protein